MRIAFAGNPNSGKTTMYNALTGRNEKVGNWAGVTVDKKEAPIKKAFAGDQVLIAPRSMAIDWYLTGSLDGNEFQLFPIFSIQYPPIKTLPRRNA